MSTFLRYLMSMVVHLAWRRTGRSGPIPPIRIPGKSKHIDLPVIGTWQLMAAMWLVKKLWDRYGHDVKGHLKNNANDLARRAASYLPDPSTPRNLATATPSLAPINATIPAPAARQYPPPPAPRPAPNLQTQVLTPQSSQTPPTAPTSPAPAQLNGAPTPLPHGSLLSKLRGRS